MKAHIVTCGVVVLLALFIWGTIETDGMLFLAALMLGLVVAIYVGVLDMVRNRLRH